MTILILAAGYATRLYPLTLNRPKPLLEVSGRPILERIFAKIAHIKNIKACFIVTNQKFYGDFKEWAANFKSGIPIEVINDETASNEERLGAVRDIEFVVRKKALKDDLLVIGGDNLFEFSLNGFVEFAMARRPSASIALFDIKDKEKAKIYGVIKLDPSSRVVDFKEKPPQPESTLIATCVYYFPAENLGLLSRYISSNKGQDAPGNYIKWLSEESGVYGYMFKEDWYDIGDMASYKAADERYGKK